MAMNMEIVAHRGASRERPENTFAAFQLAMELGADAVELDVHRTADGVIVLHHDPTITGPSGAKLPIATMPHAALASFRVRGEPIPTLAEVLALLDGRLTAYCELKGRDTAEGTLYCIAASGAGNRAAVHAFDHRQVAEALLLAPDVPRGVLEASYPIHALHALRSVQGRDIWRHCEHVDEALVQEAHAAGARVIAWTVNDAAMMERFIHMGVDALCTDDVRLARTVRGS